MHRITITVEDRFLEEIDRIMAARGYENRSEAIRDLARAGMRDLVAQGDESAEALGALVYVYDHRRRDLAQRLAANYHDHHDLSLAAMHVHLDHDNCLELAVLRGPSAQVRHLADHVIAERGVSYGRLVTVPVAIEGEEHAHGLHSHRHMHTHIRGT
jgi:CopG family nickel-responsive transcriptional regulator